MSDRPNILKHDAGYFDGEQYVFDAEEMKEGIDWADQLEEENEAQREAVELALVLLGHADFRNGNTDPGGVMDEGEVYAGRLMDKIQALVPEIYAEALKKT